MFRRLVAMAMLVSFIAMSTSGLMMFVIEKPSFTLQMHPVHKLFGLVMVASAIAHLTLNFRSIKAHLKLRSGVLALCVLSAALVAMAGVAMNNQTPADLAKQMGEPKVRVIRHGAECSEKRQKLQGVDAGPQSD